MICVSGLHYSHGGPGPYTVETFSTGMSCILDVNGGNRISCVEQPMGRLFEEVALAKEVCDALNEGMGR